MRTWQFTVLKVSAEDGTSSPGIKAAIAAIGDFAALQQKTMRLWTLILSHAQPAACYSISEWASWPK
jgi:hypothetical protein